MPIHISQVAKELQEFLNLPAGYYVEIDHAAGALIITNGELGFAILRSHIDDGRYLQIAKAALLDLIEAVG